MNQPTYRRHQREAPDSCQRFRVTGTRWHQVAELVAPQPESAQIRRHRERHTPRHTRALVADELADRLAVRHRGMFLE